MFSEPIQYLAYIRDKCYESRYKIYAILVPYKLFLFFLFAAWTTNTSFDTFFTDFDENFTNHTVKIEEIQATLNNKLPDFNDVTSDLYRATITKSSNVIYWTIFIHAISSYICYIFGKFACKIKIQTFSFSLPINLTIPLTVSTLIVLCGLRNSNVCAFNDILPDYIFFHIPPADFLFGYIFKQFIWLWIFWQFSQTWVTRHLWRPKGMRNASTEKLFILPMYDSLIIDQSMAMNRRRDEYEEFVEIDVSPMSVPKSFKQLIFTLSG